MPESSAIPDDPSKLQHHYATCAAPVPMTDLKSGINTFKVAVDAKSRGWEQNMLYGIHLRVYYSKDKAHATGKITSPKANAPIGLEPTLSIETTGEVVRVEYLGFYEDFDYTGDGVYRQWQYRFDRARLLNNMGTSLAKPFTTTWKNQWVPDQPMPMKISARVVGTDSLIYMAPVVENISLQRENYSVEMAKPYDIPKEWASRFGTRGQKFDINGNLQEATDAMYMVSLWGGHGTPDILVNNNKLSKAKFPKVTLTSKKISRFVLKSREKLPQDNCDRQKSSWYGNQLAGFCCFVAYNKNQNFPLITRHTISEKADYKLMPHVFGKFKDKGIQVFDVKGQSLIHLENRQ